MRILQIITEPHTDHPDRTRSEDDVLTNPGTMTT